MSGLIKTGIGVVTGGTSVWLPYVIVAGLVAGGTGFGMWKLFVAPRLEAAELRVTNAEAKLTEAAAANEETERTLRVMRRQIDYDRKITAQAIAEAQAKAEQASQIKKDIANVKGSTDAVDPIELYANRRLRELRAARRGAAADAVPPAAGIAPAL